MDRRADFIKIVKNMLNALKIVVSYLRQSRFTQTIDLAGSVAFLHGMALFLSDFWTPAFNELIIPISSIFEDFPEYYHSSSILLIE